jgi:hypothetical protein
MEVVVSLFQSQTGLLLLLLGGSLLFGWLVKTPALLALAATAAPLALPYIDSPYIEKLRADHPQGAFAGAWMAVFALGLAWRSSVPVVGGFVGRVGLFHAGYLVALASALVVSIMLFFAPDTLVSVAPNWRSTFGGLLLAASCLSVSREFVRVLRAGVMLAVWSCVSLILASQVFLNKMPHAIRRDDLAQLEWFFAQSAVERAFQGVRGMLFDRSGLARAFGISSAYEDTPPNRAARVVTETRTHTPAVTDILQPAGHSKTDALGGFSPKEQRIEA